MPPITDYTIEELAAALILLELRRPVDVWPLRQQMLSAFYSQQLRYFDDAGRPLWPMLQ